MFRGWQKHFMSGSLTPAKEPKGHYGIEVPKPLQCTKVYKVDGKRMPKSSFLLDLYQFMYFLINVGHILAVEGVKLPKKSFQKTSLWQNFQIWVDLCTENGYFQSAFSAWCRKMPWYRLLPPYLLETPVFRKNSLVNRVAFV